MKGGEEMDLGVAGTIRTVVLGADDVNKWLSVYQDVEVVDIKFSSGEKHADVLIIYRSIKK